MSLIDLMAAQICPMCGHERSTHMTIPDDKPMVCAARIIVYLPAPFSPGSRICGCKYYTELS